MERCSVKARIFRTGHSIISSIDSHFLCTCNGTRKLPTSTRKVNRHWYALLHALLPSLFPYFSCLQNRLMEVKGISRLNLCPYRNSVIPSRLRIRYIFMGTWRSFARIMSLLPLVNQKYSFKRLSSVLAATVFVPRSRMPMMDLAVNDTFYDDQQTQ